MHRTAAFCLALFATTAVFAGPFTHPPTDIANVGSVVPLGNVHPGSEHVLPVDHMYVTYPVPNGGGSKRYPVQAIATGNIVLVMRDARPGVKPDGFDYSVYIRQSATLTYYYLHLHRLHIAVPADPAAWIGKPEGQFWFPENPPLVQGGATIGWTYNNAHSWDVGVIDANRGASFVGHGNLRYPSVADYMSTLGSKVVSPWGGQKTINAACFTDYLPAAHRTQWIARLTSSPKGCGRNGWDIDGRIRGNWFNPALDDVWSIESAAFSIVPYNLLPDRKVQIAMASGHPLAVFDPGDAHPQLDSGFIVNINTTAGTRINPDPALIGVADGVVCYDLPFGPADNSTYNVLHVQLEEKKLRLRFDPAATTWARCPRIRVPPTDGWVTYIR